MASLGSKNWCFTLNNPVLPCDTLLTLAGNVSYAIWQLECVSKIYVQGYVEFFTCKTLSLVKAVIPFAHWEVARGSYIDNKGYCSKLSHRLDGTDCYEIGAPLVFLPGSYMSSQDIQAFVDATSNMGDLFSGNKAISRRITHLTRS